MCDPVSLLLGASAATSAVGAVMSAKAGAEASQANSQYMQEQAAYEETQAQDAVARGEEAVRDVQKAGARVQGAAQAGFASNNIDATFGSPLDIINDNARNIELDSIRVADNAGREAEGYRFQASQSRRQSSIYQMEARHTRTAGTIGAIGAVLTGGSSIARYQAGIGAY